MGAWTSTLWDHPLVAVQWIVVTAATLAACVSDVKRRRIPNALTFPLLMAGLVWASIIGGWAGAGDALLGAAAASALFIVLFVVAGGGAGDAKLMMALGAWLGVLGALIVLTCVLIAGGVLAAGQMLWRGRCREVWANLLWIAHSVRSAAGGRRDERGETTATMLPSAEVLHVMPYGVAIFLGTAAATGGVLVWHTMA